MSAEWDDLARLASAATPAPWLSSPYGLDRADVPEVGAEALSRADAEFIAAANPATILRLIEDHRHARDTALRAIEAIRRVEALADEWERTEAYRCTNAGECPRCLAYQSAVIRVRAALAAPTDTTKEN